MSKQVLWTVAVFSLVIFGLWNISLLMGQTPASRDMFAPLANTYNLIQSHFYRAAEADQTKLVQGALRGMVEQLNDPYSTYFSPDEFEQFNRGLEGQFVGVGINIGLRDGRLTIVSPIKGGPAEAAGARAGDVILFVDETDTKGMTLDEAVALLRGSKGTPVTLRVLHRDGSEGTLLITRDVIHVPTVETRLLAQGTVGYLRLFAFNENAGEDVKNALSTFSKAGVVGLVFDLRGNGGGLLDQAVTVGSQFVDSGPVLSTRGPEGTTTRNSQGNPWENVPLAVLIGEGTASASEIVAGAVQDTRMAVLIGQQSFGKGVVQRLFPLGDGGYVKLTTSEYLTPLGHHVQGQGLTPDLPVPDPFERASQLSKELKTLKPSLYTRQAHKRVDALLSQVDDLLQRAEQGELDLDAREMLDAFAADRALFEAATDKDISATLSALEQALGDFNEALTHAALDTALAWLTRHAGQRCPCEVVQTVQTP